MSTVESLQLEISGRIRYNETKNKEEEYVKKRVLLHAVYAAG